MMMHNWMVKSGGFESSAAYNFSCGSLAKLVVIAQNGEQR